MTCTCGPWHLGVPRQPCAKHPADAPPGSPTHNLPAARRRFPALAESQRKFYRINGNLAQDNKFDGED
jgi:hypothetical protein